MDKISNNLHKIYRLNLNLNLIYLSKVYSSGINTYISINPIHLTRWESEITFPS